MSNNVKGLLGEKLGMTQVWDENNKVVPVTVVQAGPSVVTQVRTPDTDGYSAVQIAFGAIDPRKVNKPDAGHFAHNRFQGLKIAFVVAMSQERHAGGDQAFRHMLAGRDPQARVIEICAGAAFGPEELVGQRVIDNARDDLAAFLERDRDRELRQAMQEVRGSIERVNDPAMDPVSLGLGAAFLADKPKFRSGTHQFVADRFLGTPVGGGNEIRGALARHLELLNFAEVARQVAPCAPGSLVHDVDNGWSHV